MRSVNRLRTRRLRGAILAGCALPFGSRSRSRWSVRPWSRVPKRPRSPATLRSCPSTAWLRPEHVTTMVGRGLPRLLRCPRLPWRLPARCPMQRRRLLTSPLGTRCPMPRPTGARFRSNCARPRPHRTPRLETRSEASARIRSAEFPFGRARGRVGRRALDMSS